LLEGRLRRVGLASLADFFGVTTQPCHRALPARGDGGCWCTSSGWRKARFRTWLGAARPLPAPQHTGGGTWPAVHRPAGRVPVPRRP
jgi:hypothetical protein